MEGIGKAAGLQIHLGNKAKKLVVGSQYMSRIYRRTKFLLHPIKHLNSKRLTNPVADAGAMNVMRCKRKTLL